MSSESPRKSLKVSGQVIRPEPVSEKSFMENMAGFIHEVVPQAYGGSVSGEVKDTILWARFEHLNTHELGNLGLEACQPLVLILGYVSGIQVWALSSNGEAHEILSWRQGATRVFRLLPSPDQPSTASSSPRVDLYAEQRPLAAWCDTTTGFASNSPSTASPHFCSASFVSLRTGQTVRTIKFKNPLCDILANQRVVLITFPEKIAVFDAWSLEDQVVLTHCFLSPTSNPNPVALGTRWLAYAEKRLISVHKSGGGFEGEGVQSYTATVIHAAKSITKGLRDFGETVASSLTGSHRSPHAYMTSPAASAFTAMPSGSSFASASSSSSSQGPQPGVVSILDLQSVGKGEVNLKENAHGLIAHFIAHANQPIAFLAFDPTGQLLFTADKVGQNFHIFKPVPGCGNSVGAVHHLYTLYRGDTTAKVQDVAFTADSRWVAVTTYRGTTHVFPITSYGGSVGVRTHTSARVVNRLSRFHRSAGLDDAPSSGRNSPISSLSNSPNLPRVPDPYPLLPYPNPCLPPYPHSTTITPLAQLRQPLFSVPPVHTGHARHSSGDADAICLRVACRFAPPRSLAALGLTLPPSSTTGLRDRASKKMSESLFVITCQGVLIEYSLEPKLAAGVLREKVCDDSAIDLEVHPCSQWHLLRPLNALDLPLPLSPSHLQLIGWDGRERLDFTLSSPPGKDTSEAWVSQVEIRTHAGPNRRLWMGPQFTFKTFSHISSSSLLEVEQCDVDVLSRPASSNPVNMPLRVEEIGPSLPVIIGDGSCSSYEQSPRFVHTYRERYHSYRADSEGSISGSVPSSEVEIQLKENLADAMLENPTVTLRQHKGGSSSVATSTQYFLEDLDHSRRRRSRTNSTDVVDGCAKDLADCRLLSDPPDLLDFEMDHDQDENSLSLSSKSPSESMGFNQVGHYEYQADEVVPGALDIYYLQQQQLQQHQQQQTSTDAENTSDASCRPGESSTDEDLVPVTANNGDWIGKSRKRGKKKKK